MTHPPNRRTPREIIEELRHLQEQPVDERSRLSILHEISVYQEELIVQNEALMQVQASLEQTRDRFIELYDFAPNGYVTLDRHGVIREINLTAAALLGRSKAALEGLPFMGFLARASRDDYSAFLRRCRQDETTDLQAELILNTPNGDRDVQLVGRMRGRPGNPRECFTALVDVTERKELDRAREQLARDHAALASRLIAAQEDERLRIARNLHDDLGQQLTALRLTLESIVLAPAPTHAAVEQIQTLLQEFDERLHLVASELRPATLDLGIVAALGQFVREWSATARVPAAFHSTGIVAGDLPHYMETHLYRIAQEALNNVAKHASATHVTVSLESRDDDVRLTVKDNGCGFDPEASRKHIEGVGLVGLRERAQLVGGHLQVEASPGNGTVVRVRVPHRRRP